MPKQINGDHVCPPNVELFSSAKFVFFFWGGGGRGDNATEDMLMATKNRNGGHVGFPTFFSFGF